MATGRQAFSGTSTATTLTAILRDQPAHPSQVNPQMPAELDRIITKALEKDRDLRCQTASEIRADLKRLKRDTASGRAVAAMSPSPPPQTAVGTPQSPVGTPALQRARRRALPWAVAGVLLAAIVFFAYVYLRPTNQPAQVVRASILPPENFAFEPWGGPAMISPDGTQLAFVVRVPSGPDVLQGVLWVRPLAALAAKPLANTEDASKSLLVARQPLPRILCQRKVEKDCRLGGPCGNAGGRRRRTRCNVESRRRDHLCSELSRGTLPSLSFGWARRLGHKARSLAPGKHPPLAGISSGRPPLLILRQEQ